MDQYQDYKIVIKFKGKTLYKTIVNSYDPLQAMAVAEQEFCNKLDIEEGK